MTALAKSLKTITVQVIVFLVGLVAIELTLRQFLPLPPHGGEYRDRNGNAVRIARDVDSPTPRLDVRHLASEFAAHVRTSELGFRKMSNESAEPDLLFLGDSFTFGHGVSDDEVFSEVLCGRRGLSCLNLGRSGTQTFDQVRLLRNAIAAHQLQPKAIVLTMLTACWLGVAGNDLGDNLVFYRNTRRGQLDPGRPPLLRAGLDPSDLLRTLQGWLGGFEITKRVMMVASSGLKRGAYACSAAADLDPAADATSVALQELAQLGEAKGFTVKVVVIHPFQDLDGGFRASETAVGRALPSSFDCIGTGAKFRAEHYYPYDGHLNASGHANLAGTLDAELDRESSTCKSG